MTVHPAAHALTDQQDGPNSVSLRVPRLPPGIARVIPALPSLLDQALYSAVNFVGTITASRGLDPFAFGRFAALSVVLLIGLGLARSAIVEPMFISGRAELAAEDDAIAGTVGAVFGIFGLLIAVPLFVLTGDDSVALLPLVASGACAFEIMRGTAIAHNRARQTLLPQAGWIAAILILTLMYQPSGPIQYAIVWLAPSWPAALSLARPSHCPKRRNPAFLLRYASIGRQTAGEFGITTASSYLAPLSLAFVGATDALGGVRLLQTLFGPLTVAYTSIGNYVLPRWREQPFASPALWKHRRNTVSGFVVALAAAWGLTLVLMPERWLVLLVGETWSTAGSLAVAFTFAIALSASNAGPILTLRSRRQIRTSIKVRHKVIAPTVLLPLAGAILGDGIGFVVGLCAGNVASAIVWQTHSRLPNDE